MKKRTLFILLICVVCCTVFLFVSCKDSEKTAAPMDLQILVSDKTDVPAGEYALEYQITNYEKYKNKYQLKLTVNVYDEYMEKVEVKDARSIVVENDKTYKIGVILTGVADGKQFIKSGQFDVVAVKSDVMIKFLLPNKVIVDKKYVKYGESFNIEDCPEIPDYFYSIEDDYIGEDEQLMEFYKQYLENMHIYLDEYELPKIKTRKWVYYPEDNLDPVEINEEILQELKTTLTFYSNYEYEQDTTPHVLKFETNGGTPVEDFNGSAITIIPYPEEPKKEGCSFMCWCFDKNLKIPFDWTVESVLYKDLTLYAKWVENDTTAAPDKYFDYTFYEKEDDYGYSFYSIKAKDPYALTGKLRLPNSYNGYPIRGFEIGAFKAARITEVYIPNTYDLGTQSAFSDCQKLKKVEFQEGTEIYSFDTDMFYGCIELSDINIPDTIEVISDGAFTSCRNLVITKLPESLYLIERFAFFECESIYEITIPDSVETIDEKAFGSCLFLSKVNISENSALQTLGDSIFSSTSVRELKLPYALKNTKVFEGTAITVTFYDKPQKPEESDKPEESNKSEEDDKKENLENNQETPKENEADDPKSK